jgi:L-iditol 2-dehydrogenase
MKAAVLTGIRKVEMQQVSDPSLPLGTDAFLRVLAVGLCGSDIQYYSTGRIGGDVVNYPFIVGHECVAEVEAVGSQVTRIQPGDRVVIDPAVTCGTCDQCILGRLNTCRSLLFLGCPGQLEGCLTEFVIMPESNCYPLERNLKIERSILVEPLSIGIYSIQLLGESHAAAIAILGSGPIGLSVALAASEKGIRRIYMTDKIDERLEAAQKAGAIWVGNPEKSDIIEDVKTLEPRGLDAVFECCGDQDALDQAVEILKPGGKLMIVGIPETDLVSFDPHKLRRKEIMVQNVRRQRNCIPEAIDLIEKQKVDVDFMVTHTFSLEETQEAFELVEHYRDGVIKAIVQPYQEPSALKR